MGEIIQFPTGSERPGRQTASPALIQGEGAGSPSVSGSQAAPLSAFIDTLPGVFWTSGGKGDD